MKLGLVAARKANVGCCRLQNAWRLSTNSMLMAKISKNVTGAEKRSTPHLTNARNSALRSVSRRLGVVRAKRPRSFDGHDRRVGVALWRQAAAAGLDLEAVDACFLPAVKIARSPRTPAVVVCGCSKQKRSDRRLEKVSAVQAPARQLASLSVDLQSHKSG